MTDPDVVGMPRWSKIAVVIAAILLGIVAATSIDFGDGNERDRPNIIGFDTTTTR